MGLAPGLSDGLNPVVGAGPRPRAPAKEQCGPLHASPPFPQPVEHSPRRWRLRPARDAVHGLTGVEVEGAAPAGVTQDEAAARGLDLAGLVPGGERLLPARGAQQRLPHHEAPARRQPAQPHGEAEGAERLRPPAATAQHGAEKDVHLGLARPQLCEAPQRLHQLRLASRAIEGDHERALVLDTRGPQARSRGQGAGGLEPQAGPAQGIPAQEVQLRVARGVGERVAIGPGGAVRPDPVEHPPEGEVDTGGKWQGQLAHPGRPRGRRV